MKKKSQEKSLITINENSIFHAIKKFFENFFTRRKNVENVLQVEDVGNIKPRNQDNKDFFMESIRNIKNEETRLLKLQKQYRTGELKEEELTKEQVISLCALYDKQIAYLKKSNESRKQKLLDYRKNAKV